MALKRFRRQATDYSMGLVTFGLGSAVVAGLGKAGGSEVQTKVTSPILTSMGDAVSISAPIATGYMALSALQPLRKMASGGKKYGYRY